MPADLDRRIASAVEYFGRQEQDRSQDKLRTESGIKEIVEL